MVGAMVRLLSKGDIVRLVVTVSGCLVAWILADAFIKSEQGRKIATIICVGVLVVLLGITIHRLAIQAGKLLKGRCPNLMCHGTVHHSENVPKGYLLCPTCKNKWPEVKGIKYRASGREH